MTKTLNTFKMIETFKTLKTIKKLSRLLRQTKDFRFNFRNTFNSKFRFSSIVRHKFQTILIFFQTASRVISSASSRQKSSDKDPERNTSHLLEAWSKSTRERVRSPRRAPLERESDRGVPSPMRPTLLLLIHLTTARKLFYLSASPSRARSSLETTGDRPWSNRDAYADSENAGKRVHRAT